MKPSLSATQQAPNCGSELAHIEAPLLKAAVLLCACHSPSTGWARFLLPSTKRCSHKTLIYLNQLRLSALYSDQTRSVFGNIFPRTDSPYTWGIPHVPILAPQKPSDPIPRHVQQKYSDGQTRKTRPIEKRDSAINASSQQGLRSSD